MRLLAVVLSFVSLIPALASENSVKELQLDFASNVHLTQTRYTVTAFIGSPPQRLTLLVDTTTPFLIVYSANCLDCPGTHFSTAESLTFAQIPSTEKYAGDGVLGCDRVTLGDTGSVVVANLTFVVASRNTGFPVDSEADGVLVWTNQGLGVGSLSLTQQLLQQGDVKSATFALYLSKRNFWLRSSEPPSVSFGGWNATRFSSESGFKFAPATLSRSDWRLTLTNPRMGDTLLATAPALAIIDSAHTSIAAPKAVIAQLFAAICARTECRGSYWNCTQYPLALLGDFTFEVGNVTIRSSPWRYSISEDACYLDVESVEQGEHWVLGTSFLQNFYLLFDAEKNTVGFANAADAFELRYGRVAAVGLGGLFCVWAVKKGWRRSDKHEKRE